MTKRKPRADVHGGNYYGVRRDGELVRVPDPGEPPDAVVCRRVADYAPARVPAAAGITPCSRCAAPIAYNPAGPHQDRPKVCMQCAMIRPLPYPTRG